MKNVALLEDLYLFRRIQSDQLISEGVNVAVHKHVCDLLDTIKTADFDLILIDRYCNEERFDAVDEKFGIKLKQLGVRAALGLWTNLKPSECALQSAGFDFHIPKTLHTKAELIRMAKL